MLLSPQFCRMKATYAVPVLLLLLLVLVGCFPLHQYEKSYELPYEANTLKLHMERTFQLVRPNDPDEVYATEVPIQLAEHLQVMTQVTVDTFSRPTRTLLTLRMAMWDDGYELPEDSVIQLFEQLVVNRLRQEADSVMAAREEQTFRDSTEIDSVRR
jgi:hypothetical protein